MRNKSIYAIFLHNITNSFHAINYVKCTYEECNSYEEKRLKNVKIYNLNTDFNPCENCDGFCISNNNKNNNNNNSYFLHSNTKYNPCDKLFFLYVYRIIFCILLFP